MKIYEVYEADTGKVVYKGTTRQIASKYNVSYANIFMYKKKCKMCRKYYIRYTGECKAAEKKPKKTKHEKTLEYLIAHLNTYGNVYSKDNPELYMKELNDMGYKVKVDKYIMPEYDDLKFDGSAKRRKVKCSTDYVITRL